MARIATRFVGPKLIPSPGPTTEILAVPANEKYILKHIHISNPTAGVINVTLSIGAAAAATDLFNAFPIPANSVYDHYPMYVMDSGEIFQSAASAAGLNLTIDGDRSVLS